jgi:hypothetical protein
MIDCFDTSAINRLHDDPERIAIVRGLLSTSVVRVTALNVIEVGGAVDAERRESLLRLLGRLAPGVRPLASPTALVRILAKAYADGNDRPIISLPDEETRRARSRTSTKTTGVSVLCHPTRFARL